MIVVVGHPLAAGDAGRRRPAGTAALAALAAARAGAVVQLIGRIGDDAAGDEVVVALAAGGVGHVALLRDPARGTPVLHESAAGDALDPAPTAPQLDPSDPDRRPALDAADLELGLRYLTDFRAILIAEPFAEDVVRVAAEAAAYAGAELIVVAGGGTPGSLPDGALVLEAPAGDPGDGFSALLGQVGAAVDAGAGAAAALDEVAARLGATRPA